MSLRRRLTFVAIGGAVAGAVARVIDNTGTTSALVLLTTCLVLGMLLVLRLENGAALPLSFAVLPVIASSFSASRYATAVAGAELIFLVLRLSDHSARLQLRGIFERVVVAAATLSMYGAVRALTDDRETVAAVLASLAVATLAQIPTDLCVGWLMRLRPSFSGRTRLAWLTVASSGVLMALGYRGVGGAGRLGIWGPLLFSTPLLATWYAFDRLDSATRAYHQTIESLAMAPEFGGLVPPGHSTRVAALSVAMADELGVPPSDTRDLEMAALLHHLGQVTMDEAADPDHPIPASEVTRVTGAMLREIKPLAAAGDIVGGEAASPRRRVAAQILRVASDYDDLTGCDGGDAGVAIETLRSAPGYLYDAKVLSALEHVVARRPDLAHAGADAPA